MRIILDGGRRVTVRDMIHGADNYGHPVCDRQRVEPVTFTADVITCKACLTKLSDAPKEPTDCPLCADVTFGTGALDHHGPEDVHPGVTCVDVAGMEW